MAVWAIRRPAHIRLSVRRLTRADWLGGSRSALRRCNLVPCAGVLMNFAGAEHVRPTEAVVHVDARVASPCQAVGIKVGLAGPGTFRQEHVVVFQQRTLDEV